MTTSYHRPIARDEGASLHWLLNLEWIGRTFRWSDSDLEITDASSRVLQYASGLEVSLTESASFLSGSAEAPSLSVRGLRFPDDIDLPTQIEAGHRMVAAPVELSLWSSSRSYEDRVVRFRGVVRLANYGASGEEISFACSIPGIDNPIRVPDAGAVLDMVTWYPDIEDNAIGQYAPLVIGKPGLSSIVPLVGRGGAPAHVVDDDSDHLLICDGHCAATEVSVIDLDDALQDDLTVTLTTNMEGRAQSIVHLGGTCPYAAGHEYWVDWSVDGGGVLDPWRNGQCLEGAGSVIRYMLARGGIDVDVSRWASLSDVLDTYKIATYLDDPADPWAWVQEQILPLLPVSLLTGPSGVYPRLWNPYEPPSIGVDVQRDSLAREGPVEYGDEWVTEQSYRFGFRSDNNDPAYTLTVTGRDVGSDSATEIPIAHLRAAETALGHRAGPTIDLVAVYAPATAMMVATWRAMAYATPWRTVSYTDTLGTCAALLPGDCVALTDSDLAWDDRRAWVAGISWEDTIPTFTFVLIDDLIRDGR